MTKIVSTCVNFLSSALIRWRAFRFFSRQHTRWHVIGNKQFCLLLNRGLYRTCHFFYSIISSLLFAVSYVSQDRRTMDVTKKNFIETIPEIEKNIQECDFVAIDLEFTGLYTLVSNDFLDTHQQYYAKCRKNIDKFQIVQMGMSLFKIADNERKFDCHSYNFYIFPNRCHFLPRQEKERYFLSQASSLSFLAENGFDFNKLIKEGISYLNLSQEKIVEEKMKDRSSETIQIVNESDKAFIDETMKMISDFGMDNDKDVLVLPQANAFRRRLIYEAVANSSYQNSVDLSPNTTDKFRISVKKTSPEEKKEKEQKALLEMIGFTHIIKLIIKSEKPLVGHNLYLDLLYIYNTFIGPLPECYSEFKSLFHSLFPVIFDTRHISSEGILSSLIPNNSLGKLYQTILENPFLQTTVDLKNFEFDKQRFHEAGYDSYITGHSFLNLIRYLYAQEFTKVTNMFSNEILDKYRNKVAILKSYDLMYMNLESKDILPVRNHVFHITFPKDWKSSNIHSLFNELGGLYSITYIDDTSAFCILKETSNAGQVIEKLIRRPNRNISYQLQLYADFMERNLDSKESKKSKQRAAEECQLLSPQFKKIKKEDPIVIQEKSLKHQNHLSDSPKEAVASSSTKNGNATTNELFEVPSWPSFE